jgi:G3E family GTPase
MSNTLIPATILTGFLGSGKTTLLKRVLSEAHGQKIAVIENEFGSENIDNEILVHDSREQIIQLNNGCVCCSIREDLRTTPARWRRPSSWTTRSRKPICSIRS